MKQYYKSVNKHTRHVFGLEDEYVNDNLGDEVAHSEMSEKIGGGEVVKENNDSLMSMGNRLAPQHYATFGWALKELTGIQEWKIQH